jgi:hypothetical protein
VRITLDSIYTHWTRPDQPRTGVYMPSGYRTNTLFCCCCILRSFAGAHSFTFRYLVVPLFLIYRLRRFNAISLAPACRIVFEYTYNWKESANVRLFETGQHYLCESLRDKDTALECKNRAMNILCFRLLLHAHSLLVRHISNIPSLVPWLLARDQQTLLLLPLMS